LKNIGFSWKQNLKQKVFIKSTMEWRNFVLIALSFLVLPVANAASDVDFERLNGSDLGMGVGARAMGMAGAFSAVADDVSAAYWNPAGLSRLAENQFLFSADLFEDISAVVVAYQPPISFLKRYDFVVGLGYINRLSFKGDSGNGTWSGYPAHLLDLAMVDVGEDFSGRVDSRTYDIRLSLAVSPPQVNDFSVGLNLVQIS